LDESIAQLVQSPQRLSTRRNHTKAWESSGKAVDEVGHGGQHMLTVVEDEQDITVCQPLCERILVGVTA